MRAAFTWSKRRAHHGAVVDDDPGAAAERLRQPRGQQHLDAGRRHADEAGGDIDGDAGEDRRPPGPRGPTQGP